jgi:hypothetical protein
MATVSIPRIQVVTWYARWVEYPFVTCAKKNVNQRATQRIRCTALTAIPKYIKAVAPTRPLVVFSDNSSSSTAEVVRKRRKGCANVNPIRHSRGSVIVINGTA